MTMNKLNIGLNIRRNSICFLLALFFSLLMSSTSWAKGRIAGLEVVRRGTAYELKVDPDGFSLPLVIEIDWGDGQTKTTTWRGDGGNWRRSGRETWYAHEHKYHLTEQTRVTITVKIYGTGDEGIATRSITAIVTP